MGIDNVDYLISKERQKDLDNIKKDVKESREYFQENIDRFKREKEFAFYSALKTGDKVTLSTIGQPCIECNFIEAFLSKILGDFSKYEPSIMVSSEYNAVIDPKVIEFTEGRIRHMEDEARRNGVAYGVFQDALCGYSAWKVSTNYVNPYSFQQDFYLDRVFSPLLVGFDPLARQPHKGDGKYCFELFPKSEEEIIDLYPNIDLRGINYKRGIEGFNWSYVNMEKKILLLCDYYCKKEKKIKIVKIAQTPMMKQMGIPDELPMDKYKIILEKMHEHGIIEQEPQIIDERMTRVPKIVRYRFVENQILEYDDSTVFTELPYIFVDGNSVEIQANDLNEMRQVTRSYFHNATGVQKLANVALQSVGNELENTIQHKLMIAEEGLPDSEEARTALVDFQIPNIVMYKAFLQKEGVKIGDIALPPPQTIVRQPMPPEFLSVLQMSFQLMQSIFGTYDAALGINDNQLSGNAIVKAAMQANAATLPTMVRYMQSLSQVGKVILTSMPKVYVEERTLPVLTKEGKRQERRINGDDLKLDYNENMVNIKIESGPNSKIMRAETLNGLVALSQANPTFGQFMNSSPMLLEIIKLLDIPNKDEIIKYAEGFVQQQMKAQQAQQQQQMQNPLLMKAQNEQMDIQREAQKNQVDAMLKAKDMDLKQQAIDNERMQIVEDSKLCHLDMLTRISRDETEKARSNDELAMKMHDVHNRHAHNMGRLAHDVTKTMISSISPSHTLAE